MLISRVFSFLLCSCASMLNASAQGLPRNEFTAFGQWFKQEGIQATDQTGPNQTFTGWAPSSWSVSANYRYWLTSRFSVGAQVGLMNLPYAYQWAPGYGIYFPSDIVSNETSRYPKENALGVPFMLLVGSRWALGGQWWINPSLGVGVAQVNTSVIPSGITVRSPDEPDSTIRIMRSVHRVNASGGPIPLVHLSAELGYMLGNMNTISLGILLQASPRRDVFSGEYTLYPGTEFESTGGYTGGVHHLGLRLGYTMCWGIPKEPGYVRKARRKAERQP